MELKIAFSNEEHMTKLTVIPRFPAPVILKERRHFALCWRMKERTPRQAASSYCRGDPCGRPEALEGKPKNTAQMRHICTLSGIEVRITWHKPPPPHNNSHNRGQKPKHRHGQPPLIPTSSPWTSAPPPCLCLCFWPRLCELLCAGGGLCHVIRTSMPD